MKFIVGPIAICVALIVGPVIIALFRPALRELRLRRKGINLELAGRPAEAEACYRASVALSRKLPKSQQVRALACLANSLIDQDRWDEARPHLDQALALGDEVGGAQASMADLLLRERSHPQTAIALAEEALQRYVHHVDAQYPSEFGNHLITLQQVVFWSRKAEALVQLGSRGQAQEETDEALRTLDTIQPHFMAETLVRLHEMSAHWHLALALLSLGDNGKAADHLRLARDLDPKGKYRILTQQRLAQLGYSS